MPDLRHGLNFIPEPMQPTLQPLFIVFQRFKPLSGNDFDGNVPFQIELMGPINLTHAPSGDEFKDHPFIIQDLSDFKRIFSMSHNDRRLYSTSTRMAVTLSLPPLWSAALISLSHAPSATVNLLRISWIF